ncbi:unnamed protein product, partial [Closterium sp. NIES-53]
IIVKIKDRNSRPRQVSPARDLSGARELVTPRVGQAAEAALSGVQAPALLTSPVAGRGLATALLLLARTTTGTTPLRRAATSTTAASATSASAASTAATDASTPAPSTASTTTTSTAPASPTGTPAPLALAGAASPARGRRSADRLETTEVGRSSRGNRG